MAEKMVGGEDVPADGGDDFHRRFREALARKKGATHANNGPHGAADKGMAGARNVAARREFRRKSG